MQSTYWIFSPFLKPIFYSLLQLDIFFNWKGLHKDKSQILILLSVLSLCAVFRAFSTEFHIIYRLIGIWGLNYLTGPGSIMHTIFRLLNWASIFDEINRIISFDSKVCHLLIFIKWEGSSGDRCFVISLILNVLHQIFYPTAYWAFSTDPTIFTLPLLFMWLSRPPFFIRALDRMLWFIWFMISLWQVTDGKNCWVYFPESFLLLDKVNGSALIVLMMGCFLKTWVAAWILKGKCLLGWLQALGD